MSFITSPGVVGFSNLQNTTAPNNVVPVSFFIASGGATSIDVAIGPKGNGSMLAQIPNSAISGGNKRGVNSVDLQVNRVVATQVVSGDQSGIFSGNGNLVDNQLSTICGGNQNTIHGQSAHIGGGNSNVIGAAGTLAVIGGGSSNQANSTQCFVGSGSNNIASGSNAAIIAGVGNNASGVMSTAWGQQADTRGVAGTTAFAAKAAGGNAGGNQVAIYQGISFTTDATPTVMTGNGAAAAANNTITPPDRYIGKFVIDAVAFNNATGDYKATKFEGLLFRGTGVGTVAIDGAPGMVTTQIAATPGAAAWGFTVTANLVRGGLDVTFTGAAASTIRAGYTAQFTECTL